MDPASSATADELLAQAGWIRSLASRLVRDEAEADDLVQETLLASITSRPDARAPLRPWLAQVLRKRAAFARRSEQNRRAREEQGARTEAVAATDELVARAELQRQLVEAVLALRDPYRSALLLHYFEGRAPAEIARLHGLPPSTVRNQLMRGLELVREAMDHRSGGDRRRWALALVPLAAEDAAAAGSAGILSTLVASTLVMSTTLKLVAVIAALAAAAWLFTRERGGDALAPAAPEMPAALARAPDAASLAAEQRGEGRDALPAAPALAAPEKAAPAESIRAAPALPVRLRGRVLDVAGRPIAGVPIVANGGPWMSRSPAPEDETPSIGTSDGLGNFELELVLGRSQSVLQASAAAGFATVRAAIATSETSGRELLIVVAPAIEVEGTVVAPGGAALARARVALEVPLALLAGFPVPLDATVEVEPEVRTDERGRFRLAGVPALAGAGLVASKEGHTSATRPAPAESVRDLWIELAPEEPGGPWLHGTVLHASGEPAVGARVRLGEGRTEAGADGSFRLAIGWMPPETPLVAVVKGLQPAVEPRFGERVQDPDALPPPITLVLGGPTLAIAGRVLDERGEPARGWTVGLLDPTLVELNQVPADTAEGLAKGSDVETTSAKDGSFQLKGLSARDYTVRAYQRKTLLSLRAERVAAGTTDLVLRVPADALHERVIGTVVSRSGAPIAGAHVGLRLVTFVSGGAVQFVNRDGATTDAAGQFELERVPRRGARIDVDGLDVIPVDLELGEDIDPSNLRLEVARRCHLRVEPGEGADAPTEVEVHDADGQQLPLFTFQGNGWSNSTTIVLSRLGTHPLGVSEDARTLVWMRDYHEQRRVAIQLIPGEVAVVRP